MACSWKLSTYPVYACLLPHLYVYVYPHGQPRVGCQNMHKPPWDWYVRNAHSQALKILFQLKRTTKNTDQLHSHLVWCRNISSFVRQQINHASSTGREDALARESSNQVRMFALNPYRLINANTIGILVTFPPWWYSLLNVKPKVSCMSHKEST